jgi:ferredoxin
MKFDRARLVANPALCDGHGICVLRSPDLLTLDAWGFVGVEETEPLSGRDLRRARSAVAACPERALSLVPVHVATGNGARARADSSQ